MTNAVRQPDAYRGFLEAKVRLAVSSGYEVPLDALHPWLKPHAAAVVKWMLHGGCRAVFAGFGLHKTSMQIEAGKQVLAREGGYGLIVAPLGVRREFMGDAAKLDVTIRFVRGDHEIFEPGLYLTNYESARDGKFDLNRFTFLSLDEAAVLRGMGGTKTFRAMVNGADQVPYRFVATATPDPNEFIELLAYAQFLGVMDIGEAKTRFFRRNSEKADQLTIHPHKEEEFWLWVSSWALFFDKPSDIGDFSDDGYVLPELVVNWREVKVDHREARERADGQGVLFRNSSLGVVEASAEKRSTMLARVAMVSQLIADRPGEHCLIWHDLEDERRLIEDTLPEAVSIYGSQDLDQREALIGAFANGYVPYLAAKPVMLGAGTNLQRHCAWAIYAGVSSKFHDFIQSVHRLQRFGQTRPVVVDIIYAESEREVVENLRRKWRQHDTQRTKMREIIRQFGLTELSLAKALTRAMFDEDNERVEVTGESYRLYHNDCVLELRRMASDSVHLVATSIPFSTQYEYTPSFNDFGHTDDNPHFFKQMGFLAPELFRVLMPGRVCAIHVKDRIVPGGLTGYGFQTVYPFADDVRRVFGAAGFAYLGEKTNLTDVVRENNQTYRLGHTEQLKDGSRMGAGIPEKVLLFRKPPSDSSNGYADLPVVKGRPDYVDREGLPAEYDRQRESAGAIRPVPGTGYSRARWQIDAHHLMRSSGDRLLKPDEWATMESKQVYRLWKAFNLDQVYSFEHHVAIGEHLQAAGRLPPDFMLLPPHSWHEDVWTDVAQMRSLNLAQHNAGAEKHLCPLPFDIVERLIIQFSMPGEWVLDPFGGLMTVPYCALKLGRCGIGMELNPGYFASGCHHVRAMADQMAVPTLFDAMEERPIPAAEDAA